MQISSKFKRTILLSHRYKHQQKIVLKKQIQKSLEAPKVEVLVNTSQAIRVPYHHPNHKSHSDRRKNQKKNYQYYSYKEQRQNRQLSTIDPQIILLRVYLGWTNSQLTQHFHTMFRRKYRLISSNVATTNTQCHEKALRARTRNKVFHNCVLRTKQF